MIVEAFDLLSTEYSRQVGWKNPPKTFIPLEMNEIQSPVSYFNQMASVLSDGTFGGKFVFVDEVNGRLGGRVLVYNKDFSLAADYDAERITAIRCGLMAALAIDRFFMDPNKYRHMRVGFIGNGRINQATAQVLNELWGIWDFRLCGSQAARGRNLTKFPGLKTIALTPDRLSDCDVVISCTNNNDPDQMVSANEISGPRLFIAQDSGFMFDHTFRDRYRSFTDNVEQLQAAVSHEFQLDPEPPVLFGNLNHPRLGNIDAACVYLYGIALADVVTAKVMAMIDAEAERSIAA